MIQRDGLLVSLSCLFFIFTFAAAAAALQCYAGSRGYIKGQLEEHFVNETCDEGMVYCIESYSDDFEAVTTSCQTLSTGQRILNLCKTGKELHTDGLTTRCCNTSLCNNVGVGKKPKKN